MADKRKTENKVRLWAELDKSIEIHQKALNVLAEYQERSGLSKKDALVFLLASCREQLDEGKLIPTTDNQQTESIKESGKRLISHGSYVGY